MTATPSLSVGTQSAASEDVVLNANVRHRNRTVTGCAAKIASTVAHENLPNFNQEGNSMKIVSINAKNTKNANEVAFNVDAPPTAGVMDKISYGSYLFGSKTGSCMHGRVKTIPRLAKW